MKKLIIVSIAIILAATTFFTGCVQTGTGTLVLQITDAPGDLNISQALVTLSSIEVHKASAGNNNTSAEWEMIVEDPQSFDLIQLRNVKELLGTKNLTTGKYTQIRLHIDYAQITINNTDYDLQIPSESIKLISGFWINESQTTTLTLDFDVNESVHKTGSEKYILQPTIKVIQE
jgi:hypothetical protein